MSASMDQGYAQLKKSYDEAKDEQSKAMLKASLDSYEQTRKETAASKQAEDPAITYNRQLLAKYENALNALATEVSKWEDKPGEAQKSMQEFEKNVDKAVQDAKKK
jgi:hypothetical protein